MRACARYFTTIRRRSPRGFAIGIRKDSATEKRGLDMGDKLQGQVAKAYAPHGYSTSGPRGWPEAGKMGSQSQNVSDVMKNQPHGGSIHASNNPPHVSRVTVGH